MTCSTPSAGPSARVTSRATTPGISVRMYDDAVRARDERDRFIDARLAVAIEDGHITVHFQPIVLLATGRVVGVESLARWTDPLLGVVNPMEFIGRAEATGQIDALGLCRSSARPSGRRCALGLPARRHRDRRERVGVAAAAPARRPRVRRRRRADPRRVRPPARDARDRGDRVDARRGARSGGRRAAPAALARRADRDRRLRLGPLGARLLPLVDRRRRQDRPQPRRCSSPTDDRSRAVVASIVDLSRRIGMQTIAEGVEDDEVAAVAGRPRRRDALQGWNYARAVPIDRARPHDRPARTPAPTRSGWPRGSRRRPP